jgi:hypothetical protein
MLAVSDPAADVTSTQTWQAVADGRATGTWTSPFATGEGERGTGVSDPDALPSGSSGFKTGTGPRLAASAGTAEQVLGGPESGPRGLAGPPAQEMTGLGSGRRQRPDDLLGPDATGPGAVTRPGPAGPGPESEPGSLPGQAGRGRRLAPWSPQAAAARAAAGRSSGPVRSMRASEAGGTVTPGTAGPSTAPGTAVLGTGERTAGSADTGAPGAVGGRRRAAQAPRRRSGHRRYPRSAILVAVVLVLVAGGALYLGSRLISRSHQTASPRSTPAVSATPTPTPSPTLGPYGHIASRLDDPAPLTIAQLYPASFTAGGASFTRTADRLSKSCGNAVVGSNLQSAIGSAGCTQAARATYLSGTKMGTIGVFNLKTANDASKAGRAAGASNFVAQVPGRSGPTKKLGHGTGVEEAVFKGHYLILIWAEFTNLRTPKTKAQQASLATFMSQLLQSTANISLSNRMANGTP